MSPLYLTYFRGAPHAWENSDVEAIETSKGISQELIKLATARTELKP